MRFSRLPLFARAAGRAFRIRVLRSARPFILSWHITKACNGRCRYCDYRRRDEGELELPEIKKILSDAAENGVRMVHFSGGEPLFRPDIDEIIKWSKSLGLFVGLATNGILVPAKFSTVGQVDDIKLSLDGEEKIHDRIRGQGTFQAALKALDMMKSKELSVRLSCVISALNFDSLSSVIDLARKYDVDVKFQPVSHIHAAETDISGLLLRPDQARLAYEFIRETSSGVKQVFNSDAAINYHLDLVAGGGPRSLPPCFAGRYSAVITPDGFLAPCTPLMRNNRINIKEAGGFKTAVRKLSGPVNCEGCWCLHTLELNLMLGLRVSPFAKLKRLLNL